MGKSTISTGPFSNSQSVNVYQRVLITIKSLLITINSHENPRGYRLGIVWPPVETAGFSQRTWDRCPSVHPSRCAPWWSQATECAAWEETPRPPWDSGPGCPGMGENLGKHRKKYGKIWKYGKNHGKIWEMFLMSYENWKICQASYPRKIKTWLEHPQTTWAFKSQCPP